MSSIAEFYSQNLATEVKKGMGEKIKGGGTVGRAPIGYQNIRLVDDKGREERTVITDPERAPLIKLAFEEYATGNWTVADWLTTWRLADSTLDQHLRFLLSQLRLKHSIRFS